MVRALAEIHDDQLEITVLVLGNTFETKTRSTGTIIRIVKKQFSLLRVPFSFKFPFVFWKELRTADIVHFHQPFPVGEWLFILFSWFHTFRSSVIITYHSDLVNQRLFHKIYYWFIRQLCRKATLIIATSEPMKENSAILKLFKNKVQVIPIVEHGPISVSPRNYDQFSFYLFVGRLVYYKGLRYAIEALKNTNSTLVLVGIGPLENELRAFALSQSVEKQIIWKGSVSDKELQKLYLDASVLLFPSIEITEAMGLVQAEAMAYGLPIINTSLPTGVPWVARHEMEAITVVPKDSNALHHAMIQIAEDKSLREELGTNGRKRYEELFSIERMKEEYKKVYLLVRKNNLQRLQNDADIK